jgi:hypothetical protein
MILAGLASNGNRVGLFRHGAHRRPEGESVCPFPCAHIDLRRPRHQYRLIGVHDV